MMEQINGQSLKEMLRSGMNNLKNHSAQIDALNVFPVPDGDTGTNMTLTFTNGVKAALDVNEDHVGHILKALSRGLLMGARGNSGVITSQILRGIYQALEENETMEEAINRLTKEMIKYADNLEFEKAAEIRDKIKELTGE